MKIACYFPNKPLLYGTPSGDRTTSEYILAALSERGHVWQEISFFRSRWFWLNVSSVKQFPIALYITLKRFKEFRPHIWLTHHSYYKSPDVFGWWMTKNPGKARYVMFQAMYSTKRRKRAKTKPGYLINLMALKRADLVFTNNYNDINDLKRVLNENRIVYVPPGIYPEHFKRDEAARKNLRLQLGLEENTFTLLTVARFRKGVKWLSLKFLIESVYFIQKGKVPFKLLIIGSGPMEKQLKGLASELLNDRVIFVGEVPRENLYKYYSASDLFVFPGIGESLGMVYLEAQACGLPVIALDGPGVRQVIQNKETGILVREKDTKLFAEAIEGCYSDKEMRKGMGKKAMLYVARDRNAHKNMGILVDHLEKLVNE